MQQGSYLDQNHFAHESKILHLIAMIENLIFSLLRLIAALPLPLIHGLGRVVGFFFGFVVRYHRKDAFIQLERSIPELSLKERKRIINAMYFLQGINMLEVVWYSIRGRETLVNAVEIEGMEYFEEARGREKGVLILSAHIGNFELIPKVIVASDYTLSVISKSIKNARLDSVVKRLRSRDDVIFLPTKNAYRDCLKALRKNDIVGMIIDQNMTRQEGIFIDFFGKPACSSPGLAYMAAQSKAPIVPAFIRRKPDGGFKIKMYPLIEPPVDRDHETIHAATQAYNKIFEDVIREAPEEWIWMHRRWKTTPRGGDASISRKKRVARKQ